MTRKEAISVMLQAAEIGRQKAAYSFDDAALIAQAIKVLTDLASVLPDETVQQAVPTPKGVEQAPAQTPVQEPMGEPAPEAPQAPQALRRKKL